MKVLIVDDMKNFLDLEASFLKRAECQVLRAINGLEALRMAKNEKPDVIFLDLEMPVMNGLECCRFIRGDAEIKDTPIIVLTSSSKEEECRRVGCSSYLKKPVDEDIFLSEIKKFVKINERNDPRVDVSMPVTVDYKGTKTSAKALDISRFGLLISTGEPFAVGSKLTVDFSLPDAKSRIRTKAMIVREAGPKVSEWSFGLRFMDTEEKHQSAIDSFIETRLNS